jgi:hypothetical protein
MQLDLENTPLEVSASPQASISADMAALRSNSTTGSECRAVQVKHRTISVTCIETKIKTWLL